MFQVQPIPRSEIDQWPIAEAGLPTRIINSVQSAGAKRIGELRTWTDPELMHLRSFGKVSLDQIHYFFKLCSRIEKGNQQFNAVTEVLDIFLDTNQQKVISQRYGFAEGARTASRNWVTLQEIGNVDGKTRERVRQIEENGKTKLRSRMAFVCLQPFYHYIEQFIRNRAGAVSCEELGDLPREGAMGGCNPCSIALLLSDLNPNHIGFHNDFFSNLPLADVLLVEQRVLDLLRESQDPLHIDTLIQRIVPPPSAPPGDAFRRTVTVIMDHHPEVGASVDGRYFLFTTSVLPFLHEILAGLEKPAHYRAVTSTFNTRVKARSRKGAGYILETLGRSPRCLRVDRGLYSLKD